MSRVRTSTLKVIEASILKQEIQTKINSISWPSVPRSNDKSVKKEYRKKKEAAEFQQHTFEKQLGLLQRVIDKKILKIR